MSRKLWSRDNDSREMWGRDSEVRYSRVGDCSSEGDPDTGRAPSSDEESDSEPLSLHDAEERAMEGDPTDLVSTTVGGLRWPAARKASVLEQAGLKGHLLPLLEHFELPLWAFTRLANDYAEGARRSFLANSETAKDGDQECRSPSGKGLADAPSRFAFLLSNYLMVPGFPAEEWLQKSEISMVLFQGSKHQPIPAGFAKFPEEMGAFYLRPRVMWKRGDMEYTPGADGSAKGTFKVNNAFDMSTELTVQCTGKFDILQEVMQSEEKGLKKAIPHNTKQVVCLYPSEEFAAGGFLYLDERGSPISVNQLSVDSTSIGFRLGEMQKMAPDTANILEPIRVPITLPFLRAKGARFYCFVGPGLLEQLQAQSFKDNTMGGYAYWFEDEKDHRFFPIKEFSRVAERAPIRTVGSAMVFSGKCSCDDVHIGLMAGGCSCSCVNPTDKVAIQVVKLKQRGLTHPIVLRSLFRTRNDKSLESEQIRAIVTAAFNNCSPHLLVEVGMTMLIWMPVTAFTKSFRLDNPDSSDHLSRMEYVLLALIIAPWLFNVVKLLLGIRGHFNTFGSLQYDILRRPRLLVRWLQTVVQFFIIMQLLQGKGDLQHMRRSLASMLLAACGALLWIQMLYLASPFIMMGTLLFPIVNALGDVASFFMVSAFLMGASVQASYALTSLPLSTIFLDTYLMASGPQELRMQLYISKGLDLDEQPNELEVADAMRASRIVFAYVLTILFSFLLMVSMANIFIQVMGDAYNMNRKKVLVTLTRARAEESLINILWMAGLPQRWASFVQPRRDFVWFTRQSQPPEDEEDEPMGANELRKLIESLSQEVSILKEKVSTK